MHNSQDEHFLQITIEIAEKNIAIGGGPFGAIIVKNGNIIASSGNKVRIMNDPTAHAEIEAIRLACSKIKSFSLENCTIFSSCEPCPMCLGAIYWAKISRLVYGASKKDAARGGFDDNKIYTEIAKPNEDREIPTFHLALPEAQQVFEKWINTPDKLKY